MIIDEQFQKIELLHTYIETSKDGVSILQYESQNNEVYTTIIYNGGMVISFETREQFEIGKELNAVFCHHESDFGKYKQEENVLGESNFDVFNSIKVKYENKKLTLLKEVKLFVLILRRIR